jgi:hypothetical protein
VLGKNWGICAGKELFVVVIVAVGIRGRDWDMPLRFEGSRNRGSPWRGVGGARGLPEALGIGVCGSVSILLFVAGDEEEGKWESMSARL